MNTQKAILNLVYFGSFLFYCPYIVLIRMGCGDSSMSDKVIYPTTGRPSEKEYQTTVIPSTLTKGQSKEIDPKTALRQKKQIKNNHRKQKLSREQIEEAYDSSKGDLQKMFDELSERISEYYMQLSIDAVDLLSQHKLNQVETKVFLSEQFLLLAFDIFKVVGEKTNYQFQIDLFKNFNKSQNVLIGYLKQKYPRAGNIFVPGDLIQVFKDFNMCDDNPEVDLLRKAGICFMDSSNEQIIKKLKLFFNTVLDELDEKFPKFQSLLQDKVFYYEVEGKKKSLNYKIGRKIPQNTAKYQLDQVQELAITSPEVFRMIIKWITDMQSNINNPDEYLSQKSTYKTYNFDKSELQYDEVTEDEVPRLVQNLRSKLKDFKGSYRSELEGLLMYMDMFNVNLIKILYTTERKQKFVPEKQANVIKFAMYNTKLVSWLVAQKLIMVLKNLINAGIQMQNTEVGQKIDLVKFNVKDLLRAMVVGTKKQILAVYDNLKKMEVQGKLKIVQIRSRLGTPLNDIMIIFTFEKCFILCQLQLVLSEGQGVSDKIKSIQVMNHFLYEMVRSPYGVLSQVAVLLGYKDNKINYEDKITFVNKYFEDFKGCEEKHRESIINQKIQIRPIICTQCTQFYHPFQNTLGIKMCEKCYIYQCCKCSFQKSKNMEQNQVQQRFTEELQCQMSQQNARKNNFNSLSKFVTIDDILKVFYEKKYFFNTLFKKHYQKILPKDVHLFIKQKSYNVDLETYEDPYFLIVQFRGTNTFIKVYNWSGSLDQIQNCFNQKENFYEQDKIGYSYYDFILFFHPTTLIDFKSINIQNSMKFCFKTDTQFLNIKKVKAIQLKTANKIETKAYLIMKIEQSSVVDGENNEFEEENKKSFIFSSITEARKSLPNVSLVQQNFQMKNFGITTSLLNDHFMKLFTYPSPNVAQKSKIRILNLHNNKITDISIILSSCIYAQSIMVSKNFLKSVKMTEPLNYLTKLILFQNKISQIKGFEKIPIIQKLNFQNNQIKQLPKLNFKNLRQLLLSNNFFTSFNWLQNSDLPMLENLALNQATQYTIQYFKNYTFAFPKLKSFKYNYNHKTNILKLNCPQIKFIESNDSKLKTLQFSSQKLQYLSISSNELQNISSILAKNYPNLKKLEGSSSGNIQSLPKLNSQNLISLDLSYCGLENIKNLEHSNLPKLENINFNYNKFTEIPETNLKKLKSITIEGIDLSNIQQFSKGSFPQLSELSLSGNIQVEMQQCPTFIYPELKKFKFFGFVFNSMDDFAQSKLPKMQILEFQSLKMKQMAQFQFDALKQFQINRCRINSFAKFNQSNFKNVQLLNVDSLNQDVEEDIGEQNLLKRVNSTKLKDVCFSNCKSIQIKQLFQNKPQIENIYISHVVIDSLPILNLPKLKKLDINNCQLKDVGNLAKSKLDTLEQLQFVYNQIEKLPKLNLLNVTSIILRDNAIKQLKQFALSNVPKLEKLDLDSNKLEEFPVLKMDHLKNFSINYNPITSIANMSKCKMSSLEMISIGYTELIQRQLPVLHFSKLTYLEISNSNLVSIHHLEKSVLPSLDSIFILGLNVKELPVLKFPKLTKFQFVGSFSKDAQQEQVQYNQEEINVSTQEKKQENTIHLNSMEKVNKWDCPQLEILVICSTKLTSIPKLNLPKLKKIVLKQNMISDCVMMRKSNLPLLEAIDLSSNPITKNDVISNCYFDQINYTGCNFQNWGDFSEFTSKSLILSSSHLKKISKLNLKETVTLNLDSNEIEDISSWLSEAPKLQSLYLNQNKIKSFPQILFLNLKVLNLKNNMLTQINLRHKYFPSLETADLKDNQIQKVDEVSAKQLQYLDLNDNKLKKINFFKKQDKLAFLQQLQFLNNEIQKIEYLPNCGSIYLGNNLLKNVDWIAVSDTDRLRELYLNQNKITDVSGFSHKNTNLASIQTLSLNQNEIKNFFNCSFKFPKLLTLDLSVNYIEVVDKMEESNYPELNSLFLNKNKLKKIGPNITLKNLYQIHVGENSQLCEITGLNCESLNQISMSNCKVSNLIWLNKLNCPNLITLSLQNNQISFLPKLDKFKNLCLIEADNNPIENVQQFLQSQIVKNITFNYTLKPELTLERKKQLKQKIQKRLPISYCSNPQLAVVEQNMENINNQANEQNLDNEAHELDNIPNAEVVSLNR